MFKLSDITLASALVFAVAIMVLPAKAVTIDWTLSGGTFNDGGTWSGSFTVDTVLEQVVSWNITTSVNGVLGHTFNAGNGTSTINTDVAAGFFDVLNTSVTNIPEFYLNFIAPLDVAGHNIIFGGGEKFVVGDVGRSVIPGAFADGVESTPSPIPGSGLLSYLIGGFGGLAAFRKKLLERATSWIAFARLFWRRTRKAAVVVTA